MVVDDVRLMEDIVQQEEPRPAPAAIEGDIAEEMGLSLLDALPYIDEARTPEQKAEVDKLIQEEMRTFKPRGYMDHLPAPKVRYTKLIEEALEAQNKQLSIKAMDLDRYTCKGPPPQSQRDLTVWRRVTEQAMMSLNYEHENAVNIELMKKFGTLKFKRQVKQLRALSEYTEKMLESKKAVLDRINRNRKQEQMAVGPRLSALQTEWWGLIKKNNELETACELIRRKIQLSRIAATKKGVDVAALFPNREN